MNHPYFDSTAIDTLLQEHSAFYSAMAQTDSFPTKHHQGLLLEQEQSFIDNILEDRADISDTIEAWQRSTYLSLMHSHYILLTQEDKASAREIWQQTAGYVQLFWHTLSYHQHCEWDTPTLSQEGVALLLGIHCLTEAREDIVATSVALLETEIPLKAPLWFLLSILSPESLDGIESETFKVPYAQVLSSWNTPDSILTEQHLSLLCEAHVVAMTEEDGMFSHPLTALFPYEILVWLKLRERAGLKNPKSFTHPLMHTPIAKMFLEIKEPLPKPTELPYAKALLEKLKEKCPEVEIPQWLEETSHPHNDAHQPSPTESTHASTTGNYQAHLPEGHPDTEKLKANPFAYNRYNKGEPFSYEGLEEYDSALIEWRLREE